MTTLAFERTPEERIAGRRLWGLFMICRDPWTAESVLRGERVLAANLTAEPLRRALRGRRLPAGLEFVRVTHEMLDAVAEAGPIVTQKRCRELAA